jgi:hypothetical protein
MQNLNYYQKQWASLRRLKIAFWTTFLISFPGLMAVQRLTESGAVRLSVLGVIVLAWLGLLAAWIAWRCPRCEQYFHMDMIYQNPIASECKHCGLPKGSHG